jgi:hypothetical protein
MRTMWPRRGWRRERVFMSVTMIKDLARAVAEQERHRKALADAPPEAADGAAPEAPGPAAPPDSPKDSPGTDR